MNSTKMNIIKPDAASIHITETAVPKMSDDISFIVKDIMMYKLGLEECQLRENANIKDDLGIDSLDIIELQMELEKRFGITIKDEEGEKLKTVENIIHFIKDKI